MSFDLSEFLEAVRGFKLTGVSVTRYGEELARFEAEHSTLGNIYSGTKSFTSVAAGFAVAEGLFSPEDKVVDCFAMDLPEALPKELEELRLKHLLSMTLGFEKPLLLGDGRIAAFKAESDWVRYCLRQPFSDAPGERFLYTNAGPYLTGVLIERRSGQKLQEYLKPRLLDPLGISLPLWEECPQGHTFGASGFHIDLDAFSRFGQFLLQRGRWEGRQLLSEEWVDYSTQAHIGIDESGEFGTGYGLCFWAMPEGAFRAEGKYEQYCVVLPKKQAVISVKAMNTSSAEDRPILRAVQQAIINRL